MVLHVSCTSGYIYCYRPLQKKKQREITTICVLSQKTNLLNFDWLFLLSFRKYVKSFYWSVLTLMTIGETPSPQTNLVSVCYLGRLDCFPYKVGNLFYFIFFINAITTKTKQ